MATTSYSQEFTASGTFNVPTGVTAVWVTMIGGGGGGGGVNSIFGTNLFGGGGGGGECCERLMVKVTSGGTVTVTIGAAGPGGTLGAGTIVDGMPSAGGTTSFGAVQCRGGYGAAGASSGVGGPGGGMLSTQGTNRPGATDDGRVGTRTSSCFVCGGAGGWGGFDFGVNPNTIKGGNGATIAGWTGGVGAGTNAVAGGSGGGASTMFGQGAPGITTSAVGTSATTSSYGTGGGGAGFSLSGVKNGGAGAPGYVLVEWAA